MAGHQAAPPLRYYDVFLSEKLKPDVATKHEVTCDRPLSANSPVNGKVTCQTELDIVKLEHNGR